MAPHNQTWVSAQVANQLVDSSGPLPQLLESTISTTTGISMTAYVYGMRVLTQHAINPTTGSDLSGSGSVLSMQYDGQGNVCGLRDSTGALVGPSGTRQRQGATRGARR